MEETFPVKLNNLEVRGLVLLSLFLQIVLISGGNRRKYIRRKWVGVILWLCYLSADVVATTALGVLSRASDEHRESYAIMACWAPFLLMHLGGPDTITAYSLADNELWSRHFLVLIGQVGLAIYVLYRSWIYSPINYLWLVIFAAGIIKYGERTLVLFWASRDQFRKWMVSPPDPGLNYAKFMYEFASKEHEGFKVSLEEVIGMSDPVPQLADTAQGVPDDASSSVVLEAYPFFSTFKQLFADLILSFQDRDNSISFFRTVSWDKAYNIVDVELGLIYDLFYTKAFLLYSSVGYFVRYLGLVSTWAFFTAFVIIYNSPNSSLGTEVVVTYILLMGAILIEVQALAIFSLSDWKMILSSGKLTSLPRPLVPVVVGWRTSRSLWLELVLLSLGIVLLLMTAIFWTYYLELVLFMYLFQWVSGLTKNLPQHSHRWSNAMGQYNALDRCIGRESKWAKVHQYLKEHLFWNGKVVPKGLKALLFDDLKKRAMGTNGDMKSGRYRGDMILLREMDCFEEIDKVEFDQSVLLWHMATDFCYHTEVDESNRSQETDLCEFIINTESSSGDILKYKREFSVLLSNYMMHLLITSPFMLPSGIGNIRFQDTRAEAIVFFDKIKTLSRSEACTMLLEVDTRLPPSRVNGDRSKTLLFDACRLAKKLQSREVGERWEKITQAWLDILTFAAAQCKWNYHAEKLSQGGELLTHVWLLMAHFGMTDQFQILEGYQRVKLYSV